jgi:YfiH family protein
MKINQSKLLNNFAGLIHAFTTKQSGNLAFHVNDTLANVESHHEQLALELSYKKETLVHMKQIHSNIVHKVTQNDNFENPPTCDALITNRINTPLMVMVADCSPILFYDNVKKVIAVAHAGRAGAFTNIITNVINSFTKEFHSEVQNIFVSVGPAIGSCCYEVGVEIYAEAKDLGVEYAIQKENKKYYLDIRSILKRQLLETGVIEQNIEISKDCNCCQYEKYFSYRHNKVTGRFAGVIKLN